MNNQEMLNYAAAETARLLLEAAMPENPTTAMLILHTQRAVNVGITIGLQQAEDMLCSQEAAI